MSASKNSVEQSESGQYAFRVGDELRGERATLGKSLLDVQRDLRIKASFIAAIEDCDATAFPNPGVVPGFVRSYARYLQLDPDEVFHRFCQDSGFAGSRPQARPEPRRTIVTDARGTGPAAGMRMDFPLAQKGAREMPSIPFAAIGSSIVLLALIAGLGYGGWTVLQNIQRVQFAPVEEVPLALAEVSPLEAPEPVQGPAVPDFAAPVAATALADLYRMQELEVPILVPRDGPIASIDPDRMGLLARSGARPETAIVASLRDVGHVGMPNSVARLIEASGGLTEGDLLVAEGAAAGDDEVTLLQVLAEEARPPRIVVVAERPAWIRIYHRNGTVIFERILETGEVYEVPESEEPPMVWAGNSGSVYVRIDDTLHGPIGRGTRAARDIPLDPGLISERFEAVADVPRAIADTFGSANGATLLQ